MFTVASNSRFACKTHLHRSHSTFRIAASDSLVVSRCLICICAALTAFNGLSATAQTITVTTPLDVIDVPPSATIDDLPGPDGLVSLNEALRASDNTTGHQTIGFAIPPERWWLSNIYPGQVLLQSTFGWSAQEPVTIDGTTQTAFTGDTFPGGHEMSLDGLGLGLNGDDSELFGFHGCHVGLGGNNSVIHDNTGKMRISVGPFNSGNVVRDNEAGTIELTYSNNNVVIRNVAERVRITGYGPYGSPASGNVIGGPDPADRNFITGWGNVDSHGNAGGTTVELFYTNDTLIENNYIGTTPDGMAIGNDASSVGVGVYSNNHNLTVRNNLIAIQTRPGVFGVGGAPIYLELYEGASNIHIVGNTLGLNALGEPVLGGNYGVVVSRYAFEYVSDLVQIGGPNPGEGNIIAGHRTGGVVMLNGTGIPPIGHIRLSGNSIYDNGEIGIDLMPNTWDYGPTPNDPLDADVGANGLQNYPEIIGATSNGMTINIAGQLHTEPLSEYTLEFFASPECDPSGFGQGQMFLGSTSVLTDSAGDAVFDVSLPAMVSSGWVVTSTATLEPVGATSEFSDCVDIVVVLQDPLLPEGMKTLDGVSEEGQLSDLFASDGQYLQLDPSPTNNLRKQKVHLVLQSTSTSNSPPDFRFRLASRMLGGPASDVIQTIKLMNYETGEFELVDSRSVTNKDETVKVVTNGDPSRFVKPGTNEITTSITWKSDSFSGRPFIWSVDVDEAIWLIDD